MAKKVKRSKVAWTKAMQTELRKHSKARTPVDKILQADEADSWCAASAGFQLGIGLGHQR